MKRKNIIISCLILSLFIASFCIILSNSFSNNKNITEDEELIGTYIDGEYSENIPNKDTGYVVEKIVCDNNAVGKWDYDNWGITLTNLSVKNKCNIYFRKGVKLAGTINLVDTTGKCPTVNDDGTVNVTSAESENSLLCSAPDNYGNSYYFRGNVQNNYVKFGKWSTNAPTVIYGYYLNYYKEYDSIEQCKVATSFNQNCTEISNAGKDMYWRIVRINGDGSIRLIYDGTTAHKNGETSEDRIVGKSAFNVNYNDNAYIGYMYGAAGSSTYEETHANINDSTLKTYVDDWYAINIENTNYEKYIADNIFCNDRTISETSSKNGFGTEETVYNYGTSYTISKNSLKCYNKNDAFTTSDDVGNKKLKYGVGIITTGEAIAAGAFESENPKLYLNSGIWYWTLSPIQYTLNGFAGGGTYIRDIYFDGRGNYGGKVDDESGGVKPVINLKPNSLTSGDGTINNPYTVE